MRQVCLVVAWLFFLFVSINGYSQLGSQPDSLNKKRLKTVIITGGSSYTLAMVGLNYLWYSDFEREPFHFFNDNSEWNQMDKVGHFFSTYQLSNVSTRALLWSGLSEDKAYLWGSVSGLLMLLPVELFDGYSSEYGASWGDVVANASGALLHYGQYSVWKEIRIHPKVSFQRSGLAQLRPELLGSNFSEELLKDYNGQTLWLSFDVFKFIQNDKSRFPKWLNLAIGYGANEMIYARETQNKANGYASYRQFYLGIDFDLSHIKTNSGIIKALLYTANMIHLPAPTLEITNKGDVKLRPLYF